MNDGELDALLVQLKSEERELSKLRRKLQDRLGSFPNETTAAKERAISDQRRELHVRIDALHAERRRRRDEERKSDAS